MSGKSAAGFARASRSKHPWEEKSHQERSRAEVSAKQRGKRNRPGGIRVSIGTYTSHSWARRVLLWPAPPGHPACSPFSAHRLTGQQLPGSFPPISSSPRHSSEALGSLQSHLSYLESTSTGGDGSLIRPCSTDRWQPYKPCSHTALEPCKTLALPFGL